MSDIIDQGSAPQAKMTVGFARVGEGEALEISFPYDEVLILTKRSYTVRTQHGEAVTACAGEVIYLPAGSSSFSHAEEDTEMVYVANPPSVYADHVAASAAGQWSTNVPAMDGPRLQDVLFDLMAVSGWRAVVAHELA